MTVMTTLFWMNMDRQFLPSSVFVMPSLLMNAVVGRGVKKMRG